MGRGRLRGNCSSCEKYSRLKTLYDLSRVDYDIMVARQKGRCASCGTTKHKLNVDHDHETGEVRALLCNWCNSMEGHMKTCRPDLHKLFWDVVLNNLEEWSMEAEE